MRRKGLSPQILRFMKKKHAPRVGLYTRTTITDKPARLYARVMMDGRQYYLVTASKVLKPQCRYCHLMQRDNSGLPDLYPMTLQAMAQERNRVLDVCNSVDNWGEMTSAQLQDLYDLKTYCNGQDTTTAAQ